MQSDGHQYKDLFDAVPVSVRVEDLSAVKARVESLAIADASEFAEFLEANPDYVADAGAQIRVIDVNDAALRLHGYDDKERFIRTINQSFSSPNLRAVRGAMEAIHAGRTSLEFETTITTLAGETRALMVRWRVPPGDEATYARTLLTSIDITEVRRAQTRLRQVQRLEAMGQMTSGVAHDFNNILTVIRGNAELLDQSGIHTNHVDAILRASDRASHLTERLLSFSREQALAPQSIDLTQHLSESLPMYYPALGHGIDVSLDVPAGTWPVEVDVGAFETAVLNLLLNARDALEGGAGTIQICTANHSLQNLTSALSAAGLEAGHYVSVSIVDHGCGMDAGTRQRAFEPFFTTKEHGRGSGLGLSMVYGFTRQSGGALLLDSNAGGGTTATLYLRKANVAPVHEQVSSKVRHPTPSARGRALLVEDSADVRDVATSMVTSLGFEVDAYDNATDGLSRLRTAPDDYQVVITDLGLPGGMDGLEFMRRVRAEFDVPLVSISGYAATLAQDEPALGDRHLQKPFTLKQLADAVYGVVN